MKRLDIILVEDGHPDFGVSINLQDDAFAINWDNLSKRYLMPAIEQLRHRDCGPSANECVIPESDYCIDGT